jgi:hypothetical protein
MMGMEVVLVGSTKRLEIIEPKQFSCCAARVDLVTAQERLQLWVVPHAGPFVPAQMPRYTINLSGDRSL